MLVSTSAQISDNSDGTVQKILEIQEQMVMIDKHKREHASCISNSCVYCQRKNLSAKHEAAKGRKLRTSNELERSVDTSGKNGCVIVPRSWAGKRVKITLLADKS